jgi:hypothetical protein
MSRTTHIVVQFSYWLFDPLFALGVLPTDGLKLIDFHSNEAL